MKDDHMKETIYLVRKEIIKKAERKRCSFWGFLKTQIRFVGWKIWTIQAIILSIIYWGMTEYFGKYYMENPVFLLKLLMILAIAVSMTAIPFLYRSICYRMQEVEAATYVSSVKLLMSRLFIVAVGDGVLLGSIYGIASLHSVLPKMMIFLCLNISFLVICNGYLFMLSHLKPDHFLKGSIGICMVLGVLFLYKGYWLVNLFQNGLCGVLISVLLMMLCIYQIWKIQNSSYTELQLL